MAPAPIPNPFPYHLSYDQMIGGVCIVAILVWSGFNLKLIATVVIIMATIEAWRWLYKIAPVTAQVIAAIGAFILLVLASMMGGGRGCGRRRWW